MNPYLTIYQKDYIPKTAKRVETVSTPQEFEDPVAEGFKHYLELKDESPPRPKENANSFLERVKQDKEKIGKMYFDEPLKEDIIESSVCEKNETVYRRDYVYNEGSYRDPFSEIDINLPDDWPLPESTSGCAFRDPRLFNPDALIPPMKMVGINSLGPNEKFNKILQTKTGETEYEGVIGVLGGYIVEKQLHGDIIHE